MKIDDKTNMMNHFSGRLGDMVFYKYRNMTCARMIPAETKAPSSPGQLAQQERMASLAIFYRSLKAAGLYTYWQRAMRGLTWNGYNLLVKMNLPAFDGEGRICDFSKLFLTWGIVALPDGMTLQQEGETTWRLTWQNTPCQAHAAADDQLMLFLMKDSETFDVMPLETNPYCRGDRQAIFRIPDELREFPHLYVIFRTRTGEKCSRCGYFYLTKNLMNHGNL